MSLPREAFNRFFVSNTLHDSGLEIRRSTVNHFRPLYKFESEAFIYIDNDYKYRFCLGLGKGRRCPGKWWRRAILTEEERKIMSKLWPELLKEVSANGFRGPLW